MHPSVRGQRFFLLRESVSARMIRSSHLHLYPTAAKRVAVELVRNFFHAFKVGRDLKYWKTLFDHLYSYNQTRIFRQLTEDVCATLVFEVKYGANISVYGIELTYGSRGEPYGNHESDQDLRYLALAFLSVNTIGSRT